MASVMKELRDMETVYCPRSEDIQMGVIEEEELNKYKSMVSKLNCILLYIMNIAWNIMNGSV